MMMVEARRAAWNELEAAQVTFCYLFNFFSLQIDWEWTIIENKEWWEGWGIDFPVEYSMKMLNFWV